MPADKGNNVEEERVGLDAIEIKSPAEQRIEK